MFHGLPLVLGLALSTADASVSDDLERAGREATELVEVAEELDHRIAPGRAYLNNTDAIQRFEDNLFHLMVGEYRPAAEGFFALVTTGALQDASLHRDAEWHLAEALFGMGNVVTAEARFRVIAEQSGHPFREDAVRRLLELYASTDQEQAFNTLYDAEIVRGRVKASSVVTYTIAKSFYKRGELDKAAGYFRDLREGEEHYTRSQYFLGVLRLRAGELDAAVPFFEAASKGSVTNVDQRQTQDLALLALARLAYERSDFDTAASFYQQIGGDSAFLADVLREQVWSNIKQERYDEALRAVDLFLLAYPEHRYSGSLRVVQGSLYMGCGQHPERCPNPDLEAGEGDTYERALSAFERIVADYVPVRDRFTELASSQDEPAAYFEKVLAANSPDSTGLPAFAVSMMRSDKELDAALTVYERLEQQRSDLAESEQIIAELTDLLAGPTTVGGYEASRYQAVVNQARAIRAQVELLDLEQTWLAEQNVTGLDRFDQEMSDIQSLSENTEERIRSRRAEVVGHEDEVSGVRNEIAAVERLIEESEEEVALIRRRLAAPNQLDSAARRDVELEVDGVEEVLGDSKIRLSELRVRLSQLNVPELQAETVETSGAANNELTDAIAGLRQSYKSMRPGRDAEIAGQFDALHKRLQHAQDTYAKVLDRIDMLAASEIARVRERFDAEVVEVATQRTDFDAVEGRTQALAVDLTREGFGRMADFFSESVVKAELGIIDVYWARKLQIADQRQRILDERNALVAELERRFAIIRQKMEQ